MPQFTQYSLTQTLEIINEMDQTIYYKNEVGRISLMNRTLNFDKT